MENEKRLPAEKETHNHQSKEDLEAKADYLFGLLNDAYMRAYLFDKALLGRLLRLVEVIYASVTLRYGSKTQYRQLVESAKIHIDKYGLNFDQVDVKKNRLQLIRQVAIYFWQHPYSCLRLLSIYRVKRLATALWGQDRQALTQWIDARFPEAENSCEKPYLVTAEKIRASQGIHFLRNANPLVSIVIPVYNNYETTLSCLLALKENTDEKLIEVIIGDDCSSDKTTDIEAFVKGVRVLKQETNVGFVENCNRAAEIASGEYLILLNNDTNVQEGWLESLLESYSVHDNVGLVGPMFIFENGSLQEAGGIVWDDASAWNYGRNDDPADSTYSYVREADYLSGACLLLKLDLWKEIGGFDVRYRPAYYEDTDLAFTIRDMGYKTLYQPKAKVVHFEGLSNGTNVGSGLKQYQVVNKKKFYEKWKSQLLEKHLPNGVGVFNAKDRISADGKLTVLIIDHYVPFWDKDAGSKSTFLYIQEMLRLGINVKFIGANFFPHQPYTSLLQGLGVEVLIGEKYAKNWKQWLSENSKYIDVIYMHRPHITELFLDHILSLRHRPKLIYFGHDLHFLRAEREAKIKKDVTLYRQADDWKKRELDICSKVDEVFYPSDVEVSLVRKLLPAAKVRQIPLYMIEKSEVFVEPVGRNHNIIFVGGFGHPPNLDGISWFIHQILPRVVSELDQVTLHLVGSEVPEELLELRNSNVIVHGYLEDFKLVELYKKQALSVVPLRFGAGVKGKVIEAFGFGLPVVTTSIGAEGIPEAGAILSIADEPQKFAACVVELLKDSRARCVRTSGYADYIAKYFSRDCVSQVIKEHFYINATNNADRIFYNG